MDDSVPVDVTVVADEPPAKPWVDVIVGNRLPSHGQVMSFSAHTLVNDDI